jgi:hypothetical protein
LKKIPRSLAAPGRPTLAAIGGWPNQARPAVAAAGGGCGGALVDMAAGGVVFFDCEGAVLEAMGVLAAMDWGPTR